MSQIWLYSVSDDERKIQKNLGLQTAALDVQITEPCTLTNPRLIVSTSNVDIARSNYFFFPDYNRYYYIRQMETKANGRVIIEGEIDPLMSNASDILGLVCLVARNEYEYNGDLLDEEVLPRITKQLTKKVIGSIGTTTSITLTTTGGGAS